MQCYVIRWSRCWPEPLEVKRQSWFSEKITEKLLCWRWQSRKLRLDQYMHMHARVHTHTHARTHMHTHTHTHAHARTHTHTPTHKGARCTITPDVRKTASGRRRWRLLQRLNVLLDCLLHVLLFALYWPLGPTVIHRSLLLSRFRSRNR